MADSKQNSRSLSNLHKVLIFSLSQLQSQHAEKLILTILVMIANLAGKNFLILKL